MSESFDYAMKIMRENLAGMYENGHMTKWADIDTSVDLDSIQAAHDRELARARDPQRLRGTKPNTFDGAIEALREFRWQHATNDEDAVPYINAVKEMHDHEIERCMREQYARGYEDGRRSMDAKHYAVAIRLMRLPLDEDSHGNLSQIAGAIWHSDFGWTQGACRALRDELVRLLGGAREPDMAIRTYDELRQSCKNGENRKIESNESVESSKYVENYKSGHITDELREFVDNNWPTELEDARIMRETEGSVPHSLLAIADRIDETFARVCEQQETVLRATIKDEAKERDRARMEVVNLRDTYYKMQRRLEEERDELQAKLDAIREVLDGR